MEDCDSRLCVVSGRGRDAAGFCSRACKDWGDCPSDWECKTPQNAQRVCVQPVE